jgi:hypothetical protein
MFSVALVFAAMSLAPLRILVLFGSAPLLNDLAASA